MILKLTIIAAAVRGPRRVSDLLINCHCCRCAGVSSEILVGVPRDILISKITTPHNEQKVRMVWGSTGTLEEIFFKTSRFDVSFCTNCFLMGSTVAALFY